METLSETESHLNDLHRALDDATEFLAAFLSCARGNQVAPALLIDATDEAIDRVAQWRAIIARVSMLEVEDLGVITKPKLH